MDALEQVVYYARKDFIREQEHQRREKIMMAARQEAVKAAADGAKLAASSVNLPKKPQRIVHIPLHLTLRYPRRHVSNLTVCTYGMLGLIGASRENCDIIILTTTNTPCTIDLVTVLHVIDMCPVAGAVQIAPDIVVMVSNRGHLLVGDLK